MSGSSGPSLAHRLLADASKTSPDEWTPCPGPSHRAAPFVVWFVRRHEGAPDIYAVASGDGRSMTIELIPAEPGEKTAFDVVSGDLSGTAGSARPDIESGVIFDGPIADRQP